jgi:hypothetical protein
VSVACVPYEGSPATGGKCDYIVLSAASPNPTNVLLRYSQTFLSRVLRRTCASLLLVMRPRALP